MHDELSLATRPLERPHATRSDPNGNTATRPSERHVPARTVRSWPRATNSLPACAIPVLSNLNYVE